MAQVRVVLTGGPNELPDRVRQVSDLAQTLKLRFGGGYEHFAFGGRHLPLDGEDVPVFQWVDRTRIAE